jgi:hypothetical protein
MPDVIPIQPEQFTRRLAELCLRSNLSAIPKKELDQHILLKSAVLLIGTAGVLSEKEITEKTHIWVTDICPIQGYDRVSMRRWLVDTGYVLRSRDGAAYQIAQPGPRPELFAAEVDQLDIPQVIAEARAEIARRKQEYLQKSKDG